MVEIDMILYGFCRCLLSQAFEIMYHLAHQYEWFPRIWRMYRLHWLAYKGSFPHPPQKKHGSFTSLSYGWCNTYAFLSLVFRRTLGLKASNLPKKRELNWLRGINLRNLLWTPFLFVCSLAAIRHYISTPYSHSNIWKMPASSCMYHLFTTYQPYTVYIHLLHMCGCFSKLRAIVCNKVHCFWLKLWCVPNCYSSQYFDIWCHLYDTYIYIYLYFKHIHLKRT